MPFDKIVKDSSIWVDAEEFKAVAPKDSSLKIGTVREIQYNAKLDDIRYVVEVSDDNNTIPVVCIPTTRWGGAHNFEEYTLRGYKPVNIPNVDLAAPANKPGDTVLIAYLSGDGRQGIIIGTLKHAGRKRRLGPSDDIAYVSQFNGLETTIKNDGEWQVTFNGLATNTGKLLNPPTAPVPDATFNSNISGSFMRFLNEGSWEVNDARTTLPQHIKIDKQAGTTTITSGNVIVKISKTAESINTTCKTYTLDAKDKITENTKVAEINATSTYTVRSPKIALGSDGIELLQQISNQLDKLATLFEQAKNHVHEIGNLGYPTSPPSQPFITAWETAKSNMKEIKAKVDTIKGTL